MPNSQAKVDYLFKHFTEGSSVRIVFENKEALLGTGPIINLSIHPIRFCEDIFFNFETNDEDIRKNLKKFEVDYRVFFHYADCIRAKTEKKYNTISIKENSLLIVGQLHEDKSVFDGKKYISILDYADELNEMAQSHSSVIYKPHPYLKSKRLFFKKLRKLIPSLRILNENIYVLLSHPSISKVVAT